MLNLACAVHGCSCQRCKVLAQGPWRSCRTRQSQTLSDVVRQAARAGQPGAEMLPVLKALQAQVRCVAESSVQGTQRHAPAMNISHIPGKDGAMACKSCVVVSACTMHV